MLLNIFFIFITGAFLIYAFYFIGNAFFLAFKIKSNSLFYAILFGNILAITVISCWITKLTTINLGFLLLFIFYFLFNKKHIEFNYNFNLKKLFYLSKKVKYFFIFYLLFFILQFILIINLKNYTIALPLNDLLYYSDIHSYFKNYGIETINLNPIIEQQGNVYSSAYHYFYIWNNFINALLNGKPPILNFLFFSLPFYQSFLVIGLVEIFNLFGKKQIIFPIIIIFISGSFFPFYIIQNINFVNTWDKYCFFENYIAGISIFKPITYSLFIIAIQLIDNKKNFLLYIFFLLALSIISVSNAPIISFTGIAWLIVCMIIEKKILSKEFIYLGLGLIWIYLFYYIRPQYLSQPSLIQSLLSFLNYDRIYSSIIISAELILKGILLYSAWFLVILFMILFSKKNDMKLFFERILEDKIIYLLYCLLLLSAFLSWVIFPDIFGAKGIAIGIYVVLLKLGIVGFLLYFILNVHLKSSKNLNKLIWTLLFLFSIYLSVNTITWQYGQIRYNIEDVNEINKKIYSENKLCFVIENEKEASPNDYMRTLLKVNPYVRVNGNILLLNNNNFNYLRLDLEKYIQIKDTTNYKNMALYHHPFIKFYLNHYGLSVEKVKLLFLKEYNIKYGMFANKVEIPEYLKPFIKWDYFDRLSGERVVEVDIEKINVY